VLSVCELRGAVRTVSIVENSISAHSVAFLLSAGPHVCAHRAPVAYLCHLPAPSSVRVTSVATSW
jgi:hypothetical protein